MNITEYKENLSISRAPPPCFPVPAYNLYLTSLIFHILMHLAYSAIDTKRLTQPQAGEQHGQNNSETALRYQAYQNVCDKYSNEIAAIQKYLPGWMPKFR